MTVAHPKVPLKFYLPLDVEKGMRRKARELDRTMTSVITEACVTYLSNGSADPVEGKTDRAATKKGR